MTTCTRLLPSPDGHTCETCGRSIVTEPGVYPGNTHTFHTGARPADRLRDLEARRRAASK